MGKVRHKIAVYGKMYGCTLPTVKKLEDVGAVTEIITVAYNAGYSDAETQNNRLAELEKIVVDGYNTPGEFQDWLVDSIRKAYKQVMRKGAKKNDHCYLYNNRMRYGFFMCCRYRRI